jgi:pyrroline-5-carboxylate reductase
MKILIIGAGNMGLTYAKAFVNSHVVNPDQLMVLEKYKEGKISALKSLNIAKIYTNPSIVKEAKLVILSVKPQDAEELFESIKPFVTQDQIILSIMAGITIKSIAGGLGAPKVIRAMPNLPSQIGVGMTAFTSTDSVSKLEEQTIQNLLQTTGKAIHVQNEQLINVVTAISGSGPAYVYYVMDAMMKAAQEMGLTDSVSELLVKQTFSGALNLLRANNYDCKTWIEKVASKGGTTEAALNSFNSNHLDIKMIEGIKAAFERAEALGKNKASF